MINETNLQEEMYSQIQSREIFEQVKSYAYSYMDSVYARNVYPTDDAIKALSVFDESFAAAPSNPAETLRVLPFGCCMNMAHLQPPLKPEAGTLAL